MRSVMTVTLAWTSCFQRIRILHYGLKDGSTSGRDRLQVSSDVEEFWRDNSLVVPNDNVDQDVRILNLQVLAFNYFENVLSDTTRTNMKDVNCSYMFRLSFFLVGLSLVFLISAV